uniref:Uncharacterized protein n=1 Tax=candidate division WOR-3 bacterium TaxID=2052148 RepID=A0A7C2NYK5_UNCW3
MFKILRSGEIVIVEPMKGFPIIKDLVVDFGVSIAANGEIFKKLGGTFLRKKKRGKREFG